MLPSERKHDTFAQAPLNALQYPRATAMCQTLLASPITDVRSYPRSQSQANLHRALTSLAEQRCLDAGGQIAVGVG